MDVRAEKLANARKKLRDHQEKKIVTVPKEENFESEIYIPNQLTSQQPENVIEPEKEHVNSIIKDETVTGIENPVTMITTVTGIENPDRNITEYLISNKTSLEMQIKDLNSKLAQSEYLLELETRKNVEIKEKFNALESELSMKIKTCMMAIDDINTKDHLIKDLENKNIALVDEIYNYKEQLELTKAMLTTKELDNAKLQNEILIYHNHLDVARLQIQQLTSDQSVNISQESNKIEDMKVLQQKIVSLQQEIETLQKDKENLNTHYGHYVNEVNEQLRSEVQQKEKLAQEVQQLHIRENSLIEQISELEIRLQNYVNRQDYMEKQQKIEVKPSPAADVNNRQIQAQLEEITSKYNSLCKQHLESLAKIKELSETRESSCEHDNISISKLNADITSDKLAAQRATEQNKKLKLDVEELEQVVVKMTRDKLELTEKLTHEKSLSKDLILKLTDIEENTKNMNNKLKAKDDEMIRLQSGYREIERKHGKLLEDITTIKERSENGTFDKDINLEKSIDNNNEENALIDQSDTLEKGNGLANSDENLNVPVYNAMHKLQERFLKIMDEVAKLSDEKHRLEHIILQLQNETDTICEYVALYQQQRSLLQKREEERNNQIKLFESECNKLKRHLEELRDILLMIVDDEKITMLLKDEDKKNDVIRIKKLLEILQNSSLLDIKFHKLDLNAFYPCSCCSGQLIDV